MPVERDHLPFEITDLQVDSPLKWLGIAELRDQRTVLNEFGHDGAGERLIATDLMGVSGPHGLGRYVRGSVIRAALERVVEQVN